MSKLIYTGLNAGKGPVTKVVDASGVYFHLEDGRRVVDASNTGGPLGHRHPKMQEAMLEAIQRPVINEGWFWAEREKAAEELIEFGFAGESDWVGGVRFFISGSEANDAALSYAQAHTGRSALATRERAFHGMTGLARHMTVQPQWHGGLAVNGGKSRPVPHACPVRELPMPIGARFGGHTAAPLSERLAGAEELLSDVASTIIDYTQGGVYYDSEYQDRVANAARNAGSLWIADEVVTGLGRYGVPFAFQGGETRPDIVTMGKGMAGGAQPVGIVVMSKDLVESMEDKSWQTYSTFRGHPVTVAAVRAYLKIMQEENLLERVQKLEKVIEGGMREIYERHPSVSRIDGRGLHWTVELHGPDWRTWEANTLEAPLASLVSARALEAGVMIGTSGEQTSLFLAPALISTEAEIQAILNALDHGLEVADMAHAAACA